MSISTDPKTGLKRFNTRAGKATDKIRGKGYSILEDETLKQLRVGGGNSIPPVEFLASLLRN